MTTASAAKERARILAILEAHKADLPDVYIRLVNLINAGVDIEHEMSRPMDERVGGFVWPDVPRDRKPKPRHKK